MSERTCALCDERLMAFEGEYCRGCERELRRDDSDDYEDYDLTPEEKAAAERAYENSRARAEWAHYHPGVPCPASELPYPPKDSASGAVDCEPHTETQAPVAFEQSKS